MLFLPFQIPYGHGSEINMDARSWWSTVSPALGIQLLPASSAGNTLSCTQNSPLRHRWYSAKNAAVRCIYNVKNGRSDTCEKQNKKNRSLESEKKNWLLIAISGSGMMDVYQFESTVKIRTHIARQQDELWSYLLKPTWGSIGNLPDVPPLFFIG